MEFYATIYAISRRIFATMANHDENVEMKTKYFRFSFHSNVENIKINHSTLFNQKPKETAFHVRTFMRLLFWMCFFTQTINERQMLKCVLSNKVCDLSTEIYCFSHKIIIFIPFGQSLNALLLIILSEFDRFGVAPQFFFFYHYYLSFKQISIWALLI